LNAAGDQVPSTILQNWLAWAHKRADGGIRDNPAIKTFYLRLRANSKHAKPALIAYTHKFLIILNILNAMLHNKTHCAFLARFLYRKLSPILGADAQHTVAASTQRSSKQDCHLA
jgi:hypothetical protein